MSDYMDERVKRKERERMARELWEAARDAAIGPNGYADFSAEDEAISIIGAFIKRHVPASDDLTATSKSAAAPEDPSSTLS